MVTKRQCAFCAAEIEPGRGLMFVKRDGSVFHFCSGTCRKHQMTYHRVGHRLKWTRSHALRKLATRATHRAESPGSPPVAPASEPAPPPVPPAEPSKETPSVPEAKAPASEEKAAPAPPKKPRTPRTPRKSPTSAPAEKNSG